MLLAWVTPGVSANPRILMMLWARGVNQSRKNVPQGWLAPEGESEPARRQEKYDSAGVATEGRR